MKMSGEQTIAAPRARVWEALNDPEVLKQCIPGCQSLEKESADRLKATVAIKIGPIGARFNGAVTLSELNPPNSYVISGEGQGGTAGFARGSARVALADRDGSTVLTYEVDAEVGGRLAQVGGPIVDATAKQLAAQFFKRFGAIVSKVQEAPTPSTRVPADSTSTEPPSVSAPASVSAIAPAIRGAQAGFASFPWIVAIMLAALAGFLAGGSSNISAPWQGAVMGIAIAATTLMGYLCGRCAGPVVVTLDPAIAQMIARRADNRS